MMVTSKRKVTAVFALGALALGIAGCGKSDSSSSRDRNISGGAAVEQAANPAPYQVGVFLSRKNAWYSTGPWGFICGGVVINALWVATTSDCVNTEGAPWNNNLYKVGLGFTDPWKPTEWDNRGTYMFDVVGLLSGGARSNYALLKLGRPIDFEKLSTVRPVDLPFELDDSWPTKGEVGQISGFGMTKSTQFGVTTLRTAQVEVATNVGDDVCGDWSNYESGERLCLSKAKGSMGGLACQSDVGGPVTINVNGRPVLAGSISEVNRVATCENDGRTLAVRGRNLARWISGGGIDDFAVQPGDGAVTLSWSPVRPWWFAYDESGEWDPKTLDYVIEISEDGGKTWQTVADGENTDTEVTIGGLTNGKEYSFRVAALNEIVELTPTHRYFTPAITTKVGRVEPPVAAQNDAFTAPTEDQPVPALAGQAPMVAEVAQPPAAAIAPAPAPANAVTTTLPAASGSQVAAQSANVVLSTFNPIGVDVVAALANVTVPSGAKVSMTVDKSSKAVCAVRGGALVAVTTGKCKVKLAVAAGKGKPKSKTTTVIVTK